MANVQFLATEIEPNKIGATSFDGRSQKAANYLWRQFCELLRLWKPWSAFGKRQSLQERLPLGGYC
jgi:hypothetical protein